MIGALYDTASVEIWGSATGGSGSPRARPAGSLTSGGSLYIGRDSYADQFSLNSTFRAFLAYDRILSAAELALLQTHFGA